jgi:signal transduction histidine kinase
MAPVIRPVTSSGLDAAIVHAARIMPMHKIDDHVREVTLDLIYDRRRDGYDPLTELMAMFDGVDATAVEQEDRSGWPVKQRLEHRIIDGNRDGLETDLEEVSLNMDLATPLGLILNELISNSLKHAFPDGRSGVVRISLHTNPQGHLALTVSDDGVGLVKDFNVENTSTLGWRIVNILATQIGGTLNFQGNRGTSVELTFRK